MKKYLLITVVVIVFLFSNLALSMDEYNFRGEGSNNDRDTNIRLIGAFTKPVEANPGDIILSYIGKHIKYDVDDFMQYKFLGRTGKNTFELESAKSVIGAEKVNGYFDKEEPSDIELDVFVLHVPNPKKEPFIMHVIDLKGNKLIYQIEIPSYLKKYISK